MTAPRTKSPEKNFAIEEFVLPHPTLAWDQVEIRIGEQDGRWFSAASCHCPRAGFAEPLGRDVYGTRDDAIRAAIHRVRRFLRGRNAPAHRVFLDELEASISQPNLFVD